MEVCLSLREKKLLALCASPVYTKERVKTLTKLVQDPNVNVNCVDQNGNSPLLLLCRMNRCDDLYACVRILLFINHQDDADQKKKIDINHRNHQGWNALLLMCRYHSDEDLITFVQLFMECGMDLTATNEDGCNALLLLSRHYSNDNMLDIFELLLKNSSIDVNCRTKYGSNCLALACRYYNCSNLTQVIQLLIKYGIDINCRNRDNRNALIILCRFRGSENVIDYVRLLIENGIDVLCSDYNGWNALLFLCSNYCRENLVDVARCLISHSPTVVQLKNKSGMTALEALSHNWSGLFHSLFDELSDQLELDPQSVGRIILNASELGCHHSAFKLIDRWMALPIESIDSKSPFDYLETVVNHSFSLCKACQPIDKVDLLKLRQRYASFRRVKIFPRLWESDTFRNAIDYDDRSTYRHDARARHVAVPSFHLWQELKSAWHEDDKITFEMIDNYLTRHSHPYNVHKAICWWCQVGRDIENYLVHLLDRVKQRDPLFETELIYKYGSSAEKTDIFMASEHDWAIALKHFRQSSSNPKEVVYAGTCPDTDSRLMINESINSSSLLLHLARLVNVVKDSVISVSVFGPIIGFSETCITIHFLYRGAYPPAMKASFDVTIAVKAQEPSTVSFQAPLWSRIRCPLQSFLVPQRRTEGSRWQISLPTVERDLVLSAGQCAARVHQLLKLLFALHGSKNYHGRDIPKKICPSSYALKTCLIQYLTDCPPPWKPRDLIRHAIGVLKRFPMDSSAMVSFYDPDIVVYETSKQSKKAVLEVIEKLERLLQRSGGYRESPPTHEHEKTKYHVLQPLAAMYNSFCTFFTSFSSIVLRYVFVMLSFKESR